MVHVVFMGLQNINDSFHFTLQRTNNLFLFMQNYLVINDRDGFWLWCVCLWVRWGVVGVGNLCYIGQFSLKNWGSIPPQVIGFAKNICVGGANMWLEKLIPKSWECIFNLCTYLLITLSLKIGKCIFTKWKIKIKSIWSKVLLIFLM